MKLIAFHQADDGSCFAVNPEVIGHLAELEQNGETCVGIWNLNGDCIGIVADPISQVIDMLEEVK